MIRLENLTKIYPTTNRKKKAVPAVSQLNLNLEPGGFGLLGMNGAGKTTALKMMATLLKPTSGRVLLDGIDAAVHPERLRPRINMITGSDRMLYYRLTGRENLEYFAALYGIGGKEARTRCEELLEWIGLKKAADQRVESYSRGMKQRLSIARGLINRPRYLFLDEPTLGLDVTIAADIRQFIKEELIPRRDCTLILTSHYMREIEDLCPRIGLLEEGRLLYSGSPQQLLKKLSLHPRHRFTLNSRESFPGEELSRILGTPVRLERVGNNEILIIESPKPVAGPVFSFLEKRGIGHSGYLQQQPGLEEAILQLSRENAL